jgi:hypothetical protein
VEGSIMVLNKQFLLSLFVSLVCCVVHASGEPNEPAEAQRAYELARYRLEATRWYEQQMQQLQPSRVNTLDYTHQLLAKDEALFNEHWKAKKEVVVHEPNYVAERQRIEKARADYLKNPMSYDELKQHVSCARNDFGKACVIKSGLTRKQTRSQRWKKKTDRLAESNQHS